jgi:hypothetical protein
MKTVTIELPESLAKLIINLGDKQKSNAAFLAALLAQSSPQSLTTIFKEVDRKVALSGLTEAELDQLLDDIS